MGDGTAAAPRDATVARHDGTASIAAPGVPLEQALATRQLGFYEAAGLGAFAGTIPFRLSTSRAMARLVAHAALTFAQHQGKTRARIVDVGAGSGRLAFHLHALDPRLSIALTDASPTIVKGWKQHPQLPTLERLTFFHVPAYDLGAALETADDEALVVVGTYLLDTLPHALLDAQTLRRAFVTADGALDFRQAPIDAFSRAWLSRLGHGRAFLPVGAFDFLTALERDVRGPTLVLLADKMAQSVSEAREPQTPRIVTHGDGASVLVNLDALRAWLGWRGWQQAPGGTSDFVVGATLLHRRERLPALFDGQPHPLDVQTTVTALREQPLDVLGFVPDGDLVLELADALLVAQVDDTSRARLGAWLLDAVRAAFVLPGDDVAFHASRVLHRLGFAAAAVAGFSTSLSTHGAFAVTLLHRAQSLAELGAFDLAREDVQRVLSLEPQNAQAAELCSRLT